VKKVKIFGIGKHIKKHLKMWIENDEVSVLHMCF